MPNLLNQLELEELSLVDRPANAEAMVSLFKRDSGKEDIDKMSYPKEVKDKMKPYMDKGMSEDEAYKKVMNDMKKCEEENEFLRKALTDNGFVIRADSVEKKAEEDFIEYNGEKITKSDDRYELVMKVKEAEAKELDTKIEKRVDSELPNWDKEVAKKLLKFDLDEKVLEALKAADAAFEAVMTEKGQADVDGDMKDPQKTFEKRQKELMEQKGLTKEAAFEELAKSKEGRELINKAFYEKG